MSKLETQHPLLMVPEVITFSVVVYTNGNNALLGVDLGKVVEGALTQVLPRGTGVGSVSTCRHGVYVGNQGATK